MSLLDAELTAMLSDAAAAVERSIDERCARISLHHLRGLVLLHGLPSTANNLDEEGMSLRGRIWKLLIGVPEVDVGYYERLVLRQKSSQGDLILVDAPRTLSAEREFRARVSDAKLVRLLNAWHHDMENGDGVYGYVQGHNLLVGPILFVMPEPDAFFAFRALMQNWCPAYARTNMAGAYRGLEILNRVDPPLAEYLRSHSLTAGAYAMPSVMSFNANSPPHTELLKLWDVALVLGLHVHLVFAVARLCAMRDRLFASSNPNQEYLTHKKWPPLDASAIIRVGMVILRTLATLPALEEQVRDHVLDSVRSNTAGSVSEIAANQILPLVVRALASSHSVVVQYAAWSLSNVALQPRGPAAIAAAGAVGPLVKCVASAPSDTLKRVSTALSALARDRSIVSTLVGAGAVEALLARLRSSHYSDEKLLTLQPLAELVLDVSAQQVFVNGGGVEYILTLGTDSLLMERIAAILSLLTVHEGASNFFYLNPDSTISRLLNAGGLELLADYSFGYGSPRMAQYAFAALLNIGLAEASEAALMASGQLACVVALRALQRPDVAERGAVLLTNLLTHEPARELMRTLEWIPILREILNHGEGRVLYLIVRSLINLTHDDICRAMIRDARLSDDALQAEPRVTDFQVTNILVSNLRVDVPASAQREHSSLTRDSLDAWESRYRTEMSRRRPAPTATRTPISVVPIPAPAAPVAPAAETVDIVKPVDISDIETKKERPSDVIAAMDAELTSMFAPKAHKSTENPQKTDFTAMDSELDAIFADSARKSTDNPQKTDFSLMDSELDAMFSSSAPKSTESPRKVDFTAMDFELDAILGAAPSNSEPTADRSLPNSEPLQSSTSIDDMNTADEELPEMVVKSSQPASYSAAVASMDDDLDALLSGSVSEQSGAEWNADESTTSKSQPLSHPEIMAMDAELDALLSTPSPEVVENPEIPMDQSLSRGPDLDESENIDLDLASMDALSTLDIVGDLESALDGILEPQYDGEIDILTHTSSPGVQSNESANIDSQTFEEDATPSAHWDDSFGIVADEEMLSQVNPDDKISQDSVSVADEWNAEPITKIGDSISLPDDDAVLKMNMEIDALLTSTDGVHGLESSREHPELESNTVTEDYIVENIDPVIEEEVVSLSFPSRPSASAIESSINNARDTNIPQTPSSPSTLPQHNPVEPTNSTSNSENPIEPPKATYVPKADPRFVKRAQSRPIQTEEVDDTPTWKRKLADRKASPATRSSHAADSNSSVDNDVPEWQLRLKQSRSTPRLVEAASEVGPSDELKDWQRKMAARAEASTPEPAPVYSPVSSDQPPLARAASPAVPKADSRFVRKSAIETTPEPETESTPSWQLRIKERKAAAVESSVVDKPESVEPDWLSRSRSLLMQQEENHAREEEQKRISRQARLAELARLSEASDAIDREHGLELYSPRSSAASQKSNAASLASSSENSSTAETTVALTELADDIDAAFASAIEETLADFI